MLQRFHTFRVAAGGKEEGEERCFKKRSSLYICEFSVEEVGKSRVDEIGPMRGLT
jgi:hypothetical protein